MDEDYKFLTYKEAAAALSSTVESIRVQARRYNWPKRKNNRKQVTIGVPLDRLEASKTVSERVINNSETAPNAVHELQKKVVVLETELKHAAEKIEALKTQCADLKTDRDAWREQAQKKRGWFWQRNGRQWKQHNRHA